ncbi:MAG: hypothetical protein QOE65_796 [Solirubrobacteraceae bacterium]|nr:hypothetical protein [Solirubrobacteraceae bacterium]
MDELLSHPPVARLRDALASVPGAWLVGGAVRDFALGRPPVDLDVVVEGDGLAAARTAAQALGGTLREHDRFGTATVVVPGEAVVDFATARAEEYPVPGALPEVRPATVDEDLARRDFTVNAIAVALADGERREFPGAGEDLERRRLRVLHPRSFHDDPTRLLRLVRYAARLGFEADVRTDALARDAIAAGALGTVSGPRIATELLLLCGEETAIAALVWAEEIGLAGALHPCFQPRLELARDALQFETVTTPHARRDLVVLATSLTRCREPELRAWLDQLGLTAAERDAIVAAALESETLAERLEHAHRPSEVRHLVHGRPPEQLAIAAALGAGDPLGHWRDEWSAVGLEIDGADLIAAGVPEGPDVGRALDAAWAAALDEGVRDRDGQLAAALRAVRGE